MEVEEIQSNSSRFTRVCNGRRDSNKIAQDDEDDVKSRKGSGFGFDGEALGGVISRRSRGGVGGPRGWDNSSRIIRVSRASGGKDRHSKVWTSRGLRDRRIRLSVNTAIQFYDLQDRLGYDQPSKAVEWLIKAAADPISELPCLNSSFPNTPNQPSNEKRPEDIDSTDVELQGETNLQQPLTLSKSACSSTSESSNWSGLSLLQTEVRERAAREKQKEKGQGNRHHNVSPIKHNNGSFTGLLTGGGCGNSAPAQQQRQWPSTTPMDYFSTGLISPRTQNVSDLYGQAQLGHSLPLSSTRTNLHQPFNGVVDNNQQEEMQQFSLLPGHLLTTTPVSSSSQSGTGSDYYNLNFPISSSLAGFNRGTLQSNFPSLWPNFQRCSPTDSSNNNNNNNLPLLVGGPMPIESYRGLQLRYGDGSRLSDQKGNGKN